MRTMGRFATTTSLLVGLGLCPRSGDAQGASDFFKHLKLPTRAFVVEGGSIALQAFVTPKRGKRPGLSGESRYPTVYMLIVGNETGDPVWASMEWQFPGEAWKSGGRFKIDSGEVMPFMQERFGVIADTAINVRISVYSDKKLTKRVGSEETFLLFPRSERDEFLRVNSSQERNALMTGWPEMGRPATEVPGSLADAELQADIQLLIWKEESKEHRDCTHEALRAEAAPLDTSAVVRSMMAQAQAVRVTRAEQAARQGRRVPADTARVAVRLGRWFMRSCDALTTYLALLLPAPGGGTDVVLRRLEAPAGGP